MTNSILTITLNPAVDLSTSVDHVLPNQKLYCTSPRTDPGGGGVNVARAICKLDGRAEAMVVTGGPMGKQLLALLAREGVQTRAFEVAGETRFSFAVTDEGTRAQYRFSLPGEPLSIDAGEHLLSEIADAVPADSYVVLSGGVAPGLPDDYPQRIQNVLLPKTDRLIVDTSKAALAKLVSDPASPLLMLRFDQREAVRLAAQPLDTMEDVLRFASELVARGVARMIVSGFGGEGSILVTETARFRCRSAPVPVLSAIGAGDAFVGAMTLALARGSPPEQALRHGVAAASATVSTEGTALCDAAQAQSLLDGCILEQV